MRGEMDSTWIFLVNNWEKHHVLLISFDFWEVLKFLLVLRFILENVDNVLPLLRIVEHLLSNNLDSLLITLIELLELRVLK